MGRLIGTNSFTWGAYRASAQDIRRLMTYAFAPVRVVGTCKRSGGVRTGEAGMGCKQNSRFKTFEPAVETKFTR
ncbi:MAG: hypothetical protein EAY75_17540 [Bacteroidetes bacterium]|nr:MAG: hypothetical protein EAY75_17540 [Bacteroidota bacterium]